MQFVELARGARALYHWLMNDPIRRNVIGAAGRQQRFNISVARGKRVLVLEKEIFPRFHIGESLLPCNMTISGNMGVLPPYEAGFSTEFGAQFHLGNGSLGTAVYFPIGHIQSRAGSDSSRGRAKFEQFCSARPRVRCRCA